MKYNLYQQFVSVQIQFVSTTFISTNTICISTNTVDPIFYNSQEQGKTKHKWFKIETNTDSLQ